MALMALMPLMVTLGDSSCFSRLVPPGHSFSSHSHHSHRTSHIVPGLLLQFSTEPDQRNEIDEISGDLSVLVPLLLPSGQTDVDHDTPNDDHDELHPDGVGTITDQRHEPGEVRFLPLFSNNSCCGEQLFISVIKPGQIVLTFTQNPALYRYKSLSVKRKKHLFFIFCNGWSSILIK